MRQSVIGVALSKYSKKGGNHRSRLGIKPFIDAEQSTNRVHIRCNFIDQDDAKEWFMGGSLIRSKLKRERDIGVRQVTVIKS
jgi:hypothetical protein